MSQSMFHRESCAGCREAVGEALTAARVGRALSTVNPIRSAETVSLVEGNTGRTATGEGRPDSAVSKTSRHARTSDIGTWEVFALSRQNVAGTAAGRQSAEAEDARREEVRPGHSTAGPVRKHGAREGGEQRGASAGGGTGGKGRDREESGRPQHGPHAVVGTCDTGGRADTAIRYLITRESQPHLGVENL